jgi:hypothetical protein
VRPGTPCCIANVVSDAHKWGPKSNDPRASLDAVMQF